METKTKAIWTVYDREQLELFAELESYDNEQLNRPEKEGKWSVLQHIEHLRVAENLSFRYLQKKYQYPENLKKVGFKSWWRLQFLKFYLTYPLVKVKAPAVLDEPPAILEFHALKKNFQEGRSAWKAQLEALKPTDFDKDLHKHPFAGKLKVQHAIEFQQFHARHHVRIIKRILKFL